MSSRQTYAGFATTEWTLVTALKDEDHPEHDKALSTLIERYWPPVYASLRRMGRNQDDAAEFTQAFFSDVVLGRRLFDHADSARGRLRTLLLTAVKRYVIDQHRRQTARPDWEAFSLNGLAREESFLVREPVDDVDQAFERRWAVAVLEEAVARCEQYFCEIARPKHWLAFESHVLKPATGSVAPPPLSRLADKFGYPSAVHVASAIKVVRKRLRMLLREVAAETVTEQTDQDAEFDRIVALLS